MSAPNLDCMDHDELRDLWFDIHCHPVINARSFFPDRRRFYVTMTQEIGSYAINMCTAMSCRERGDIEAAMLYEDIADRIYKGLPDWARW